MIQNKKQDAGTGIENLSVEVLAEVREYTDMPIIIVSTGFPKGHLYCVRGNYCEFAELTNKVVVYPYPAAPVKEQDSGGYTQGQLSIGNSIKNEHGVYAATVDIGGNNLHMLEVYGRDDKEADKNAERIVECWNGFDKLKFDNEKNMQRVLQLMKDNTELMQETELNMELNLALSKTIQPLKEEVKRLSDSNRELIKELAICHEFISGKVTDNMGIHLGNTTGFILNKDAVLKRVQSMIEKENQK